jgi:hypothetical protein
MRGFVSAPDRIRTCDLRFRRPTLYPAELRAQRVPEDSERSAPFAARKGPAERAGFEPAMGFDPHTRLAGECLQPLGHLSWGGGQCNGHGRRPGSTGTTRRRDIFLQCRARARTRARGRTLSRVRRGGRVVECTGLENRRPAIPVRGFESRPLRIDDPDRPGRWCGGRRRPATGRAASAQRAHGATGGVVAPRPPIGGNLAGQPVFPAS